MNVGSRQRAVALSPRESIARWRSTFRRWTLVGVLTGLGYAFALFIWLVFTTAGGNPADAKDFFVDPASPYATPGFVYSPVAGDVFGLLGALGFPAFTALIRGAETIALAWFAGPAVPLAVFIPPVAVELNAANINLALMACVVLGFRWPLLWVPVLLTKPTMGIGLAWFVGRRAWRALGLVLGVTALVVALSALLQPGTWADYVALMANVSKGGSGPFPWPIWERALVFVPLLVWAVRTERRWALVLVVILAAPRLYFLSPVMLLALLRTLPSGTIPALLGRLAGSRRRSAEPHPG